MSTEQNELFYPHGIFVNMPVCIPLQDFSSAFARSRLEILRRVLKGVAHLVSQIAPVAYKRTRRHRPATVFQDCIEGLIQMGIDLLYEVARGHFSRHGP